MLVGRSTGSLAHSLLMVLMLSASTALSHAQTHDDHAAGAITQPHPPTRDASAVISAVRDASAVISAVRDATARFKNVTSVDGPGEGYALNFGCVSGGEFGAMGLHYVNMDLVNDGDIDVRNPEIILFEPQPNGRIRITGADFLVPVAAWEQKHTGEGPPMLMGQLFHLFDSPNRFGLDPFYTLHVWAWKDNPNGTFVNWNPDVSCDAFTQSPAPVQ